MDIVERLTAFRDHMGLTNSQFADRAGIPRPTLSQFLSGRNKRLSDDFTVKLHTAYPELNVLWLLFGEGDMVSDANIQFSEGKTEPETVPEATQPLESEQLKKQSIPYSTSHKSQPNQAAELIPMPESELGSPYTRSPGAPPLPQMSTISADPEKRIQSIMVFYSDNSFETFYPSPEKS